MNMMFDPPDRVHVLVSPTVIAVWMNRWIGDLLEFSLR
jgi:hypothetical protein